MNPLLEQIFGMLNSLARDELLHLRDEIDDYLDDAEADNTRENNTSSLKPVKRSATGRYTMPRMRQLYDWGAVKAGDRLYVLNHETRPAVLIGYKAVEYEGKRMSILDWAKHITGWKAVNIYVSVVLEREGRPLWEVRRDAMIAHGIEHPRGEET